jgi:hypothetical protein
LKVAHCHESVYLAFITVPWDNDQMHAEAVRDDASPSKEGLHFDESHPVKCSECDVAYLLHYDDEAEVVFTFCGILADEIVVLDPGTLDRGEPGKRQVVCSSRISLSNLLKKKPNGR